ncbi:MAG: DUF5104 domain-containing protein [Oscillospiraceae bacterium]|nr:DUF5104 domain-containing protein [Oscillospiraceae bacterium]
MKKLFILFISTILFLCSCNPNKDEAYDPHNTDSSTYQINRQDTINMAEDIITYLDNKDRDNIKALFAPQIAQEYNLDAQIDKIFEIYDGASISYEVETCGEGGKHIKDGMFLYLEFDCAVKSIQTNNDKIFRISIIRCLVDDDNPDNIGLNKVFLCRADGTNIAPIGEVSEDEFFQWEY